MAQQLTGIDSSFLSLESRTSPMHVMGVLLLDPSGMEGGYSFDKLITMMFDRIHLMPQLRRKLVEVPLGIDHAHWIEDADFDLTRHVRRVDVVAPGNMRALEGMVGEMAGTLLPRQYPLWEMVVVEGVQDGDKDGLVAVVSKMHHAIIDGVSGADLMVHMFDLSPEVRKVDAPEEGFEGETPPSHFALFGKAVVNQATAPARFIGEVAKNLPGIGKTAVNVVAKRRDTKLGMTAPKTPWNGALSDKRAVAFARSSLDDMKAIRKEHGCKINDVILAATTLALRDYLIEEDALPDRPLAAAVPVALQKPEGQERLVNELATLLAPLPVQLDDPVEILKRIQAATTASKELVNAVSAPGMMEWAGFVAPRLLNVFMGMYSKFEMADLHPPIQNIVVSNVPGPPIELWVAGAKVHAVIPMGPVMPGAGLNLTVLSNMGNVDVGIMADAKMVPEPWRIAEGFPRAIQTLKATKAA